MNRIPSNFLRLVAVALTAHLGVTACKRKESHPSVGADAAQTIVVSTGENSYEDSGETIEATGTWLDGSAFPRNKAHLKANKQTMILRVANAIIVDVARPAMLEAELDEHRIEEWTDERITTAKTRCGKSERFLRIVIDRQARKITQEFTGESPAQVTLGDGITRFTNASK